MNHIIFDLHNTLIYKKKSYSELIQEFLPSKEVKNINPSDWERYESCINSLKPEYNHREFNLENGKSYWIKFISHTLDKSNLKFSVPNKEIAKKIHSLLKDPKYWLFYDDVKEAVSYLKENNIDYGFLSDWDSRIDVLWKPLSQRINSENKISIFSHKFGFCKPQKEIFEIYRNRVMKNNPECKYFISLGDNVVTDSGGVSLGIPYYQVDRTKNKFNLLELIKSTLNNG